MTTGLTHLNSDGSAHMVDVSAKGATARVASASATVTMSAQAMEQLCAGNNKKGDVLLSKKEDTAKKTLLNISNLKKGTYYVRVFSDEIKDFLKFTKT